MKRLIDETKKFLLEQNAQKEFEKKVLAIAKQKIQLHAKLLERLKDA
jgi:hypothetical protein